MKRLIFLLTIAVLIAQCTPTKPTINVPTPGPVAEPTDNGGPLDRSIPPSAGPAPEIQIGDYDKFTLSNNVEVIVVKNDKLPRVSFSLQLDVDPMLEGDKAGVIDLTGQLMRRGTKKRSKSQLDEEIDFIGASLSTSGSGVFGSSLTKHQDKLLELMSDVLLNSTFDEGELEKLKKQTISGLASQKDNPNAIAGKVASVLTYGGNHPYGESQSETTVKNVTADDCKNYYKSYFKPNTTRLVIVGDVDGKNLKAQLEKYFGDWKKGEVPSHKYETPQAPKAAEVAFVDKTGAVQSVIQVTYPVDYKPGSDKAIKARVMNTILGGGGFSGRLMQNLREEHAYTYGSRSSLRSDPLVGSFSASASVRNEVTDSSIIEILYEMKRLRDEKVDQDHLNMILNQLTGSFSRALERPETVARFARNIEKYNLPKDYYKNYLKKLRAVTIEDVQAMAKMYLKPENAHILVVGNKDEVAGTLTKFSKSGKVNFYDTEGKLVVASNVKIDKSVTAQTVIDKYLSVVGGVAKLKKMKDATIKLNISIQGNTLNGKQQFIIGEKSSTEVTMMGNPIEKKIFDGKTEMTNGKKKELSEDEIVDAKMASTLVREVMYAKAGYKTELKGVEKVNGKDAYKVVATSPAGTKATSFYDVDSGFKLRTVREQEGPGGQKMSIITDLEGYKEVEGYMFPFTMKKSAGPQTLTFEIQEIKLNTGLSADLFKID